MSKQDQAAKVIRTWQRRHKTVMDSDPDWAAQNLAIDLHNAGLITPDLPEPNDPCIFLFVPDGKGWMTGDPEALGPIVWTAPNSRIMVQQIEPGDLTPDEARGVAYALLAAANYSEEA